MDKTIYLSMERKHYNIDRNLILKMYDYVNGKYANELGCTYSFIHPRTSNIYSFDFSYAYASLWVWSNDGILLRTYETWGNENG